MSDQPDKKGERKILTVNQLTRLAFVCAEQDRASLANSWPESSKEREDALWELTQLRAYRKRRWGKTQMEALLGEGKTVTMEEIRKRTANAKEGK